MKKFLCFVLILVISFSVINSPIQVKAEEYLSEEIIDLFISMCYNGTEDTLKSAKAVLSGKELGSAEILVELLRYSARLCGFAEKIEVLSYSEQLKIATISNITRLINAGVTITKNINLIFDEDTIPLQKAISGFQIVASTMSIFGLPGAATLKLACASSELALEIGKSVQNSILGTYAATYQNTLMVDKFAGNELTPPKDFVKVTTEIHYTQEEVDTILSLVYLRFYYNEAMGSLPGADAQESYTHTFNSNCEDVPDCIYTYYPALNNYSSPKMRRNGYIFAGWYLDSACTLQALALTLTDDITVYAKWEPLYNFTISDNKVTINKLRGVPVINGITMTDITIPDTINGYVVTNIADKAFYGYDIITTLTIPKTIKVIGQDAFSGLANLNKVFITDITSWGEIVFKNKGSNPLINSAKLYLNNDMVSELTIPAGTKSINNFAFCGYDELTNIFIPDSVTLIGDYAFYNCNGLTDIDMPDSITSIGSYTFFDCDKLTNITIPYGVKSIGEYAYLGCDSLTSVSIPGSVISIGDYAFSNCDKLTNLIVSVGVSSIGEYSFSDCELLESIDLPSSLETIGACAFSDCINLKNVVLNEGLREICHSAFENCDRLERFIVPDSVETIGDFVWNNCSNLKAITIGKELKNIGNLVISFCENLETVYWNAEYVNGNNPDDAWDVSFSSLYPEDFPVSYAVIFGDSVKHISGGIFNGDCINSLTLNEGLETIEECAFYRCRNIQNEIIIPDTVTTIGDDAFWGCYDIAGLKLGENVESIGDYAFGNCNKISEVHIGKNVKQFGFAVFYRCSNIKSITVDEKNAVLCSEENVLFNKDKTNLLYYPPKSENTIYFVPDTVTEISPHAFYKANNIIDLNMPAGIKKIGSVDDCIALENVNFPEGLTSIGGFSGCSSIKEVFLPQSITNIYRDFWWCNGLTDLYYAGSENDWASMPDPAELQEQVTVYYNCKQVNDTTKVMVNDGVTDIHFTPTENHDADYIFAFYNNNKLADVKFAEFDGQKIRASTNANYDIIKILCWRDMIPLANIIEIHKDTLL